jgi:hypothetical protein
MDPARSVEAPKGSAPKEITRDPKVPIPVAIPVPMALRLCTYACAVSFLLRTCANKGVQTRWIGLAAMLTLALGAGQAAAEDPIRLSTERGSRIAAELRAHGFFCLRATTLKRTIVRLDGRRTYRVACGADGGAPVYSVTMPPGQRLGRS